jgi:hypothetical protein
MAEYKPKHDDQLASDAPMNKTSGPQPSKPGKVEGDKFQDVFDDAKKQDKQK